ncbi:MAG: hybrid sensor histidine kinase/response regulator [Bacteroidetes bacterium]|nr:MAG: hybrid sensor histidine kinase/response regulator [Bacteroidota bacterium]
MWRTWLTWLFFCGVMLGGAVWGQAPARFFNPRYFTTDEGLSQNEVTCILQDRRGFLWVGTRGGLNRFDGHTFKVFQNQVGDANSLINNSIESLFEDSQGRIWIGTKSNGLSCYYPDRDHFQHFQAGSTAGPSISGNRVIALAEGPDGAIWVGTWQHGLSIIRPEGDSIQHRMGGIRVEDILPGPDGSIWLATDRGLYHSDGKGQAITHIQGPEGPQTCVSLLADSLHQKLYLGTWSQGIIEYDLLSGRFQSLSTQGSETPRNAYHLFRDQQGRIWVGTWGQGLFQLSADRRSWKHFSLSPRGLDAEQDLYRDVLCTFQDRSGVLWLGTNGGGLCRIDEAAAQFGQVEWQEQDGHLPQEPIWAVHEDTQGTLWVGLRGQNVLYYSHDEGNTFQAMALSPLSLRAPLRGRKPGVRTMMTDRQGRLWIGTNQTLARVIPTSGGYRLLPVLLQRAEDTTSRPADRVSVLAQSSDGTFWVGSQQDGLQRSLGPGDPETQSFVHYQMAQTHGALRSNRISAICEDQAGKVWIGTYSGLHRYRPETDDFEVYQKQSQDPRSLSSDIILCLHADRQGRLWVGTPNGLNRADRQANGEVTFHCFQEKDGLPSNYIHAILEDGAGMLWVSTNRGISRFDPESHTVESYDVNDGLQSNSFMEGVACRDAQGRLYFGGIYGLNFFHPDSIESRAYAPPVAITGLRVFNQAVQVGDTLESGIVLSRAIEYTEAITLDYAENVLTLEFAALDFHAPERIAYRYQLEGLEKDWNVVSQQRSVTYTHLRPGTYTFRVSAANPHGEWQAQEAQLQITVLPPFWATWQAFFLYALLFIATLALYRRVIRQQNELKTRLELERVGREKDSELAEMKTRFFTNITHELRSPLTLISGPVEQMIQQPQVPDRFRSYLYTVHHHTQRLLTLVNQLLDFRRAEAGHMELQVTQSDVVHFAREVFLSFQELAEREGTRFTFEAEPPQVMLYFDHQKMEMVLSNLLSNAFKYSPAGSHIQFQVRQTDDQHCEIVVADDGQGMAPEVLENIFNRFYHVVKAESAHVMSTGIGLSLVKTIVELHQGTVSVESEVGHGSRFHLRLPLGRAHFSDQTLIHEWDPEDRRHYQAHAVAPVETDPAGSTPPAENHKGKLLLVEDNPDIRAFVRSVFEEEYEVHEAENGREGLAKAESDPPDLIISDIMMPEMDGQAFCQAIRRDPELGHLPVILLTARTSTLYQVQGYQSGADAYITKPFHPSVLRAQVEGLLLARQGLKEYFSQKITLQPTELEITPRDKVFLDEVMKVVEDNLLNENLSRDFLAEAMAMSPSTLYRKLKGLTDLTTNAFIRSIRLKRAAQLLQQSQYNISEIAFQVGFNDLKYFRTCFKEQFGVNPSEFSYNQPSEPRMATEEQGQ